MDPGREIHEGTALIENDTFLESSRNFSTKPSQTLRWCSFSAVVVFLCFGIGYFSEHQGSFNDDKSVQRMLLELNESIGGVVVLPSNSDFLSAAHVWNQVTGPPLAIVEVSNENDVATALPILINLSSHYNIPWRIRSGGHHYAGWSGIENGIILSLSALSQIKGLNDLETTQSLWLGPVVRVQDILQQVHQTYNYSSVIGMCRTVAVGGYALGGGQGTRKYAGVWTHDKPKEIHLITNDTAGLWARQYGLGTDQIIGARMVLANGTLIEVTPTVRPDILFSLQGAGQNNYGVVTALRYRFYPSFDSQVFLSAEVSHADMPALFHTLANMEAKSLIPTEIGAFFSNGENIEAYSVGFWYTCFCEDDIRKGRDYLSSAILPLLSTNASTTRGSWYHLSMERVPLREGNYVRIWNGFLYSDQNTPESCEAIWKLFHRARELSEYAKVGIELWGGAISEKVPNATAFYWREAIYNVHLWLNVPVTEARERFDSDIASLQPIWDEISQYLTGTYLNYAEPSLKPYARSTYGGNLEQLVQVKRELDPDNVFRNPQSIPLQLDDATKITF